MTINILKIFLLQLILSTINFTLADTKILAHYMPWYQSQEYSGRWGWHWTMDHFNPNSIDAEGRREIASHYYPLTGPYDSRDDNLLEYQVLLMKLSGFDGVIIDWYGIEDFNDYKVLHESTKALLYWLAEAELAFSICYEDRTVEAMVNAGYFNSTTALSHGKEVMDFLNTNWFSEDNYVKINHQPVLLSWGPIYFKTNDDWEAMLADVEPAPLIFTLDNKKFSLATGAYPWPPMHLSKNGILNSADLNLYLVQFYQKSLSWDYLVATAFPGFHDIYEEAGLHDSYGYLGREDGATFENTLTTAMNYDPAILQVATWNDYGEGTIIEPTVELGYQNLEQILRFRKEHIDTTFHTMPEHLRMPLKIFNLRQKYMNSTAVQNMLDDAFYHIIDGNLEAALEIVNSFDTALLNDDLKTFDYSVGTCFPNPFNPSTSLQLSLPQPLDLEIKVYNIAGQLVDTIENGQYSSGTHQISWDAEEFSAGIYFIKINSRTFSLVRKALLLK